MSILGQARAPVYRDPFVLNVKDHGIPGVARARGDGVTDDTAAIQAVLNAAASRIGPSAGVTVGAKVRFPRGVYKVRTVNVPCGYLTLEGEDKNASTLEGIGPQPVLTINIPDGYGDAVPIGHIDGTSRNQAKLAGRGRIGAPLSEVSDRDSPYSIFYTRPSAVGRLDSSLAPNTTPQYWGYRTRCAWVDYVCRLAFSGVPASGQFTLSLARHNGTTLLNSTSAPITVSGGDPLTAAKIQAAVEGMASVGVGNVVVTQATTNLGAYPGALFYDIRLTGALANKNPRNVSGSPTGDGIGVNKFVFNQGGSPNQLRTAGNVVVTASVVGTQHANDADYLGYWWLTGGPWDNGNGPDRSNISFRRWQDKITVNLIVSAGDWDPLTNPDASLIGGSPLWSAGSGFSMLRDANGAISFFFTTSEMDPMTGPTAPGTSNTFRRLDVFKSVQNKPGGGSFTGAEANWRGLVRFCIQIDMTQPDPANAFTVFASDYDYGTVAPANQRRPTKCLVDVSTAKIGTWTPRTGVITGITYPTSGSGANWATVTSVAHGLRPGDWIQIDGTDLVASSGHNFWRLYQNAPDGSDPAPVPRQAKVFETPDADTFRCYYLTSSGVEQAITVSGSPTYISGGSWTQLHKFGTAWGNRGLSLGRTSSDNVGPDTSGADLTFWGLRFGLGLDYDASVARDAPMTRSDGSAVNDLYITQGSASLRSWPGGSQDRQHWWCLSGQEPYGSIMTSTASGPWNPRYPLAISRGHWVCGLATNFNSPNTYNTASNNKVRDLGIQTSPSAFYADGVYTQLYINQEWVRVRINARANGSAFVKVPMSTNAYPIHFVDCDTLAGIYNFYIPQCAYTFIRGGYFEGPARVVFCTVGGSVDWSDASFGSGIVEHFAAIHAGDNGGPCSFKCFQSNIPESNDYAGTPFVFEYQPTLSYPNVYTIDSMNLDKNSLRPIVDMRQSVATTRNMHITMRAVGMGAHAAYVRVNGDATTGDVFPHGGPLSVPRIGYVVHTGVYGAGTSGVAVYEPKAGATSPRFATPTAPVTPTP